MIEKGQEAILSKIYQVADQYNLRSGDIQPIGDGIASPEGYLKSHLKVAWVLKEPYDDTDVDGKPVGGGFTMMDLFWKKSDIDGWKNDTWQRVAYVMHGFQENRTWDTLPWIRDNHNMINILRNIAWINMNKMPRYTSSSDGAYYRCFRDYWKEIVMEQLELYKPDVIIFGKTFGDFKYLGFFPDAEKDESHSNDIVRYWRRGNQRLLDTGHPGRKGKAYVDALIEALHLAHQELKEPR